MHDAEKLIERILLLEGHPNVQRIGNIAVGESVEEQLRLDLQLEIEAVERYRRGVEICLSEGAPGSRELVEHLLVGEEHHLDWIETQLSMIDDIGIERYLQSSIGEE